jgi:hypothetical protein
MQLYDWLMLYERKTGHKFNPFLGAMIEFDEEKGFCTWKQDGKTLLAADVCGDGRHWDGFLQAKAKELGCTKIKFGTYRNPAAFTRKYGYKVVGYILVKEVL